LEVLFPEKRALSVGERFFIFLGTVLPFCYFSVVRKVPEKPVLFLPHPLLQPSFMFASKLQMPDSKRRLMASPANVRLAWKLSRGTNTLAYLTKPSVTKGKKFYSFDTSFSLSTLEEADEGLGVSGCKTRNYG